MADKYQIRSTTVLLIDREGRLRLRQECRPFADYTEPDEQVARKIEELGQEGIGGQQLAEGKEVER